jgi:hypothetical protein
MHKYLHNTNVVNWFRQASLKQKRFSWCPVRAQATVSHNDASISENWISSEELGLAGILATNGNYIEERY